MLEPHLALTLKRAPKIARSPFSVRSTEWSRRPDLRRVKKSKRQGSLQELLNKSGRQVSCRWLAFSRTSATIVFRDREVRWLEITNLKKLAASVQRIVLFPAIEISVRSVFYE